MGGIMRTLTLCSVTLLVSGCDYLGSYISAPSAPKVVSVDDSRDGPSFIACKGDIHIIPKEAGYQIEFIDEDGLTHTLYGIKKFSLTDVPQQVKSNIPDPEPDLYNFANSENNLPTYSDGNSIHNGTTVVWKSGAQAKLVIEHDSKGNETGRHWERVWIHNKACDPTT
jgi:hypothetical protein